jgi:hypothetical protein
MIVSRYHPHPAATGRVDIEWPVAKRLADLFRVLPRLRSE